MSPRGIKDILRICLKEAGANAHARQKFKIPSQFPDLSKTARFVFLLQSYNPFANCMFLLNNICESAIITSLDTIFKNSLVFDKKYLL